jgi:hypothetical protein
MEDIVGAGYVVARENFKEAGQHVSAETDPVMFNLLFGLQSLTSQIEADLASLLSRIPDRGAPAIRKKGKPLPKRKGAASRKAGKKARRRG